MKVPTHLWAHDILDAKIKPTTAELEGSKDNNKTLQPHLPRSAFSVGGGGEGGKTLERSMYQNSRLGLASAILTRIALPFRSTPSNDSIALLTSSAEL